MKEAFIVESVRTPGCRNKKGKFKDTRPEDLLSFIMRSCVDRAGLDPANLEDIMCGCAFPEGEQGLNIGRIAGRMAGFPNSVSGVTVNRFCASGLEGITMAHAHIKMGWSEVTLGAGVESMTFVPMGGNTPRPHAEYAALDPAMYVSMGITAENVAQRYNITREEMDKFAMLSHAKAKQARDNGLFTEIVPTPAYEFKKTENDTYKKTSFMVEHDDGIRDETTLEGMAKLNSPFKVGGSVTAANSSQTTDGAAATLLASEDAAKRLNLTPIARITGYAVAGCKSDEMGVGPKYAIPKVLKQTGLTVRDLDIIELNEAFASQAIHCMKELEIWETDLMSRVNIHGGAIALGHPLGCSGAKLTATCLANLKEVKGRYGLVSMCIGGGMGAACIFERI